MGGERTVAAVDGNLELWRQRGSDRGTRLLVRGDLSVIACRGLRKAGVVCLGNLTVEDCPRLRTLNGEVFGDALVTRCGIEALGADFRCAGHLFLAGCGSLKKINCEVGGDIAVNSCGVRRTGPAFTVGGGFHFCACVGLEQMEGRVGKSGKIVGSECAVDCSLLVVRADAG